MKARLLMRRRLVLSTSEFVEMVLWAVPAPVAGSVHGYKYRLALVSKARCVLRYDNEAGKGDHRHWNEIESDYRFSDPDRLIADFLNDVRRWRDENGQA